MPRKLLILLSATVVASTAVAVLALLNGEKKVIQSHDSYVLNLRSDSVVPAAEPVFLDFDIRNQNNEILKEFNVVQKSKMHLLIVRKDRTNFQHEHPVFDESTGLFRQASLTFPADGEYRTFAAFTPSNSQIGPDGTKLPVTLYQDVQAGDMKRYTTQPIGKDRLMSNANGFETGLFISPDDDSPDIVGDTFYSEELSTILIYINKDGQEYDLQADFDGLDHMVALGPKLEFIQARALKQDSVNKQGLIAFEVSFPDPGQYKIYLSTQLDNQANIFDYNLTVLAGVGEQND